jgi:hypothetical protein
MPKVARRSQHDEEHSLVGDEEGVWVDRLPAWQTRPLSKGEVTNVTTLLMSLMDKSGFNSVQIAQVFYRGEDAKTAATRVRMRLKRMRDDFAKNGFKLGLIP